LTPPLAQFVPAGSAVTIEREAAPSAPVAPTGPLAPVAPTGTQFD
jgi:hypothetical protein